MRKTRCAAAKGGDVGRSPQRDSRLPINISPICILIRITSRMREVFSGALIG